MARARGLGFALAIAVLLLAAPPGLAGTSPQVTGVVPYPLHPARCAGLSYCFPDGPVSGGARVIVAGHDFAPLLQVFFGATPARSFTQIASGVCASLLGMPATSAVECVLATSPAAPVADGVDVRVRTSAGLSATNADDLFGYYPVIASVTDASGNSLASAPSGTTIVIHGMGFGSAGQPAAVPRGAAVVQALVTWSQQPVPAGTGPDALAAVQPSQWSPTAITATVPPYPAGSWWLSVALTTNVPGAQYGGDGWPAGNWVPFAVGAPAPPQGPSPAISAVDDATGSVISSAQSGGAVVARAPSGSTITIIGANFGGSPGSLVRQVVLPPGYACAGPAPCAGWASFGSPADVQDWGPASVTLWLNPADIAPGVYAVAVQTGSGDSNIVDLAVVPAGGLPSPIVDYVASPAGQVLFDAAPGAPLEILGQNFGALTGLVRWWPSGCNPEVSGYAASGCAMSPAATSATSWGPSEVDTQAPASDGSYVVQVVDAGGDASNLYPFQVVTRPVGSAQLKVLTDPASIPAGGTALVGVVATDANGSPKGDQGVGTSLPCAQPGAVWPWWSTTAADGTTGALLWAPADAAGANLTLGAGTLSEAPGSAPPPACGGKDDATDTVAVAQPAGSHGWKELQAAVTPSGRIGTAMAYDSASGTVVLFGGVSATPGGPLFALGDTWIWNGTSWSQRQPSTSPAPRAVAAVADDPAAGGVVLFGGNLSASTTAQMSGGTWVWNGATWTRMSPPVAPAPRDGASMAYDPDTGDAVLFGGCCDASGLPFADTWLWDGATGTWTEAAPAVSPPGRVGASMAYDPAAHRVVMFGGLASPAGARSLQAMNDTWTWDGRAWQLQSAAGAPPPLFGAGMAYDPVSTDVVLLGGAHAALGPNGVAANVMLNDTWTWNGTAWALQGPATAPPGASMVGMATDAAQRDIVVFPGYGAEFAATKAGSMPSYDLLSQTWVSVVQIPLQASCKPSADAKPWDSWAEDANRNSLLSLQTAVASPMPLQTSVVTCTDKTPHVPAGAAISWDWGDGSPDTPGTPGGRVTHKYLNTNTLTGVMPPTPYTITETATAPPDMEGQWQHTVTVATAQKTVEVTGIGAVDFNCPATTIERVPFATAAGATSLCIVPGNPTAMDGVYIAFKVGNAGPTQSSKPGKITLKVNDKTMYSWYPAVGGATSTALDNSPLGSDPNCVPAQFPESAQLFIGTTASNTGIPESLWCFLNKGLAPGASETAALLLAPFLFPDGHYPASWMVDNGLGTSTSLQAGIAVKYGSCYFSCGLYPFYAQGPCLTPNATCPNPISSAAVNGAAFSFSLYEHMSTAILDGEPVNMIPVPDLNGANNAAPIGIAGNFETDDPTYAPLNTDPLDVFGSSPYPGYGEAIALGANNQVLGRWVFEPYAFATTATWNRETITLYPINFLAQAGPGSSTPTVDALGLSTSDPDLSCMSGAALRVFAGSPYPGWDEAWFTSTDPACPTQGFLFKP